MATHSSHEHRRRTIPSVLLLLCALIGMIYGSGTSALNHTGPGLLAMLLGHGAAWAGLGVLVGWALRRRGELSIWRCIAGVVLAFGVAVITYYATDVLFDLPGVLRLERSIADGAIPPLPSGTPVEGVSDFVFGQAQQMTYWMFGAVLLGAPIALAGVLMARPDRIGLIARIAGPLVLVAAMFIIAAPRLVLVCSFLVAAAWLAIVLLSRARQAPPKSQGSRV